MSHRPVLRVAASALALCLATAYAHEPLTVHPSQWPAATSPVGLDATTEARISTMLAAMSVEEKVGQVVQPDWRSITPPEVTRYHIGSIENGGGGVPGG